MDGRALFFLITTNFLGGSSYVATTYALKGFPETTLVLLRTMIGAALFLPFLIGAWPKLRLARADWLRMAAVGVFGYAAPLLIGTIGQKMSSATNAALLVGVEPVSIVLLSALFLGERMTALKAAAIAAGAAGASVIVLQGIPLFGAALTPHLAGDLLLILHGCCWALYTVLGKPLLGRVDIMSFSAITMLFALPPLAAAAVPELAKAWPAAVPSQAWLGVLYLGLGVSFLGIWSWNMALKVMPASRMANFLFLQPLIGSLLGALVEKQALTRWSLLGGFLILLGIGAATRSRH